MSVKPIPDGYHTLTPYLIVKGAARALEFYRQAFGAVELMRVPGKTGGDSVGHAEIRIGDSIVMLADEHPEIGAFGPTPEARSPVGLMLYIPDVDAMFTKAVAAGGKVLRPIENQFYGDRAGTFQDPFGHVWTLATHVEDVSPEELQRRMQAFKPGHA